MHTIDETAETLTGLLAHYGHLVRREIATLLDGVDSFHGIMRYHLGLADQQLRPIDDAPGGKGLRGALVLLVAGAFGGDEAIATPLAAAVELLHNFSLVHDDIEDGSATRRHRATVWSIWGAPIGINIGDGIYAVAHLALLRSSLQQSAPGAFIDIFQTFATACFRLAEGQHADMSLERATDVSVDDYLAMIDGKTATLIGAAARIGARAAGADMRQVEAAARFGHAAGMAFQMQDDILGIWGDEHVTGKSAVSDIESRKKTLPVLLALAQGSPDDRNRLRALYAQASENAQETREIVALLDRAGAHELTRDYLRRYREAALTALDETGLSGPAAERLRLFERLFAERTA